MDTYFFSMERRTIVAIVICCLTIMIGQPVWAQVKNYYGEKSTAPVIPPKEQRIRVIIASDAATEVDDVWAISLALLYPERFEIEGFVGGNFDYGMLGEFGPESIEKSTALIRTILSKAGMAGKYPVYAGSQPMQYHSTSNKSPGVDFIIKRAMAGTPENPLWIIGLGSATDIAAAYLQEPAIKDRIVVFWHGRTQWPFKAYNYNIFGDMHAARILFHTPLPFVLFDTGGQLSASMEDSKAHVKPYGELGEYLYNYRLKNEQWKSANRGFFDMGDIAVLIDPEIGKWEAATCPTIEPDLTYNFYRSNGKLLRCYDADREKTFELLYKKLKEKYEKN
ncbi:nucleoside hydrolase [Chitinophaga sp. MM2321]|uniref:nucleoside hydrolase n=1 Tax=Chitinophaga sp. MM2321 TaxID=3137178 RepID=UPI0032D56E60